MFIQYLQTQEVIDRADNYVDSSRVTRLSS